MNDGLVNDFMDGYAGEPLFIHEPIPADLTTPVFVQKLIGVDEHFVQQKSPQTDVDLLTKEFLLSGFLVDMRLFKKKVEPTVMEWLLSCICSSSDCDVVEGAFNAFWAIVMSKDLVTTFSSHDFVCINFLNMHLAIIIIAIIRYHHHYLHFY